MLFADAPFFPEQASSFAGSVDALGYYLVGLTLFFTALIFTLVITFAVKYRRRPGNEHPPRTAGALRLELTWTVLPLFILMSIFGWGASVYFHTVRPPDY